MRKHLIAKSAQEIIPAEYSHLFGKVEKTKKYKPKTKRVVTKVITTVSRENSDAESADQTVLSPQRQSSLKSVSQASFDLKQ